MSAETKYLAHSSEVTISTANPNLDGTGTLGTVITATAGKSGLFVKTIYIKARGNTAQGVIRLFIYDGTNTKLFKEVYVPPVIRSATVPTFQAIVPMNFTLKTGWSIKASTENADYFNVIADAQDWYYYTTSVRAETTLYTHYNIGVTISTANSNMDGSGATGSVLYTATGCNLMSITIKSKQSTTEGMIRIFLWDTSTSRLLIEVPVPAITCSATEQAFYHKIVFENGFAIAPGWYIVATTEKGEAFNVFSEALTISYPA